MINPISNATPLQPTAQTKTSAQKPTESASQTAPGTDSVALSKAAQAMVAAMKEAAETPAQTAQEAGHGDLQARALLAKEATAKSAE
jgi:hypothetical protein